MSNILFSKKYILGPFVIHKNLRALLENWFFSSFQCLDDEKSPAQAKKFWGHFFQKIDVFRKILRFLAVFNGFLAVFSASTTKKAPRRRKICEPLFLRAGGARKIFRPNFHFSPIPPRKKLGDNVWRIGAINMESLKKISEKYNRKSK